MPWSRLHTPIPSHVRIMCEVGTIVNASNMYSVTLDQRDVRVDVNWDNWVWSRWLVGLKFGLGLVQNWCRLKWKIGVFEYTTDECEIIQRRWFWDDTLIPWTSGWDASVDMHRRLPLGSIVGDERWGKWIVSEFKQGTRLSLESRGQWGNMRDFRCYISIGSINSNDWKNQGKRWNEHMKVGKKTTFSGISKISFVAILTCIRFMKPFIKFTGIECMRLVTQRIFIWKRFPVGTINHLCAFHEKILLERVKVSKFSQYIKYK